MDKLFGKKPTMKGNYFNYNLICLNFKLSNMKYQKHLHMQYIFIPPIKIFQNKPEKESGLYESKQER